MGNNDLGMSSMELYSLHPMNPEVAAHNIALAYIQSALKDEKLQLGELYGAESAVTPIVLAYSDVYNFAYNYVIRENKDIAEAE